MASKAKATHQGSCQVCGRLQMLPAGKLSKHGYTKKWGFFQGTCWGAGHQPFELSKDLIVEAIKRATENRDSTAAYAAQLRADTAPATVWVHEYVGATSRNAFLNGDTYMWREMPRADVKVGEFGEVSWKRYERSNARDFGKAPHTTVYDHEIRTAGPDAIFNHLNRQYAEKLDKHVASLNEYISWQQARIANWAPHPEKLVARKEAA